MTMADEVDWYPSPAPRRHRLKRKIIGLLALVPLVFLVGGWAYVQHAANSKLRGALAEADRLDPGWRLSELEAKRAVVPDAENSAWLVQEALKNLPRDWLKTIPPWAIVEPRGPLRGGNLYNSLFDLAPDVQLDAQQLEGLRADLDDLASAVADARALAEMPWGRPGIAYARNPLDTPLSYAQEARQVARLLQVDAMLRAQEGDIDGALDSGRALMNVGRSIGDEPFLISQLVRIAIGEVALGSFQRALAQGEPSDAAMAKVQDLLAEEASVPILLIAMRGERANLYDLFSKLSTGEVSLGELNSPLKRYRADPVKGFLYMNAFLRYNRGLCLDFMNRAVEISKRPDPEQAELWKRWDVETRYPRGSLAPLPGMLTYLLTAGRDAFQGACFRYRAELQSAWLMVALERRRQADGHWPLPEDIASIKPPPDPWKEGPIRFAGRDGGLTVYSLGPDRIDDGGKLHPRRHADPGYDVGYRLWDVARRRRSPEPKVQTDFP